MSCLRHIQLMNPYLFSLAVKSGWCFCLQFFINVLEYMYMNLIFILRNAAYIKLFTLFENSYARFVYFIQIIYEIM
jgi:hypothetical protein